jgi:hypothetical protein
MAAVGAACSPSCPNFGRVLLALAFGRLMDNLPAGVMCPSGVLKGGLGVLGEAAGSGVILSRPDSLSGPCQSDAFGDIARRT